MVWAWCVVMAKGVCFPTTARSVYDITGAGDLVLAMFGICLATGVRLEDAAQLANVAAGLKVERFGASVITRHEIHNELLSLRSLLALARLSHSNKL